MSAFTASMSRAARASAYSAVGSGGGGMFPIFASSRRRRATHDACVSPSRPSGIFRPVFVHRPCADGRDALARRAAKAAMETFIFSK